MILGYDRPGPSKIGAKTLKVDKLDNNEW